jgi:hypothetical protein
MARSNAHVAEVPHPVTTPTPAPPTTSRPASSTVRRAPPTLSVGDQTQMNPNINPDPPAPQFPTPSRGGPVTPEGRARSSRNSLRHGLTAQAVVLETESKEDFAALLDSFLTRFHPSDPVEHELVEAMAAARWRLRRLYTIESRILEIELLRRADSIDQEFTGIDDPDRLAHAFQHLANHDRSLSLLLRYETTLTRTYDRAFKQLTQLQSAAKPAPVPHTSAPTLGSFRNPPKSSTPSTIGAPPYPCPSVSIREPIPPSAPQGQPPGPYNPAR